MQIFVASAIKQTMLRIIAIILLAGATQANGKNCNVDDKNTLMAMKGGHVADGWPATVARCGHDNLNIFTGVNQDNFKACILKTTNISDSCNTCYAKMAQYDFDNCKMQCLFNWCSVGCITCNRGYDIKSCAGWDTLKWPQPTCCTSGCKLPPLKADALASTDATGSPAATLAGLFAGSGVVLALLRARRGVSSVGKEPLLAPHS